jgi:hypothetical protein
MGAKYDIIYNVKGRNAFADIKSKPMQLEKIFEKLFKNPLTNNQKCGIILVSRGEGNKLYLW